MAIIPEIVDAFHILESHPGDDLANIAKNYRRLALVHHSDKARPSSEDRVTELNVDFDKTRGFTAQKVMSAVPDRSLTPPETAPPTTAPPGTPRSVPSTHSGFKPSRPRGSAESNTR